MNDMMRFVGTWKGDRRFGRSDHTFTWTLEGEQLHGRWVIEAPTPVAAPPPSNVGGLRQIEMQVGEPWIENGVLLFHVNAGPFVTEFRMVSDSIAIAGAAMDKLPPEFAGPEHQRSIEAHRVQFTRVEAAD